MVFSGDLLKETYSKFKPEYTCWFDKSTWKYLDKYQVLCLQVQVSTKYFWISKCQVQVSTKYSRFCIKYQVSSTSTLLDPNPGPWPIQWGWPMPRQIFFCIKCNQHQLKCCYWPCWWIYFRKCLVNMVITDGLAPMWSQNIGRHHNLGWRRHVGIVPRLPMLWSILAELKLAIGQKTW